MDSRSRAPISPLEKTNRASGNGQTLALSTATAVVLFRLTGAQVDGRDDPETRKRLNVVARALANVAPIYVEEPPESAKELSPFDLLQGEFRHGAQVFRTHDGRELAGLTIERRDMLTAINLLQAAGIQFR